MEDIKPLNLNSEPKIIKPSKKKLVITLTMAVILGIGTGYGIFKAVQPKTPTKQATLVQGEAAKGTTYGIKDEKAFTDNATGKLESGGIDGEGSHHLSREGGESQTVYLTSSVIDLDKFVNKQVKVWGQTFEAQKAGWLMDVGRLEVLE